MKDSWELTFVKISILMARPLVTTEKVLSSASFELVDSHVMKKGRILKSNRVIFYRIHFLSDPKKK